MPQVYTGSKADVAFTFDPQGSHSILVGCNRSGGNGVTWSPHAGGHAISFGMTRSGKGLQIIGALCQYSGSTLTIDPVGANAWATAERRRQLGHRVVILDPFDEVNRRFASLVGQKETPTRFNPLAGISASSPDFAEDVMMLADAVIIDTGGDPHWSDSARALVAGLIAGTIENAPAGQASFRHVRKLLTSPDADLAAAVQLLHDRNPNSFAGRNLRRFLPKQRVDKKGKPIFDSNGKPVLSDISTEISSIRSTADTQTFPFESLRLLDSMETDTDAFDLRDLGTQPVDVFLVLPVDRLATYGRWLRLIITLAIRGVTRAPRPPRLPVLFILDELGTINPGGGLRMIEQAYGLMAGQGIRIWAFLQNLKQLQHDYPHSWETFISNSDFIQLLKVNDNSGADYFSSYMGFHEKTSTARAGVFDHKTVQMRSVRGPEQVFRPDQIRELAKTNESLCLYPGGKFFRMNKVNYYADPRFRGLYRDNPQYASSAPPKPAPASTAAPAAAVPPVNLERVAELGKAAAGKVSGWFAARREAAAAREEAEAKASREAASMAERARWAETLRNAK